MSNLRRTVHVKVKIPLEQYAGLLRFKGRDDSERINAIIRMANRRVDQVAAQGAAAVAEALEPAPHVDYIECPNCGPYMACPTGSCPNCGETNTRPIE